VSRSALAKSRIGGSAGREAPRVAARGHARRFARDAAPLEPSREDVTCTTW
jgi:hypothetical protein